LKTEHFMAGIETKDIYNHSILKMPEEHLKN